MAKPKKEKPIKTNLSFEEAMKTISRADKKKVDADIKADKKKRKTS